MKHLPTIAGALLGLLFIFAASMVLLNLAPAPPLPEGSPAALFMAAIRAHRLPHLRQSLPAPRGILVIIPRTRNFGLLVLGPIIINIVAYHTFIMKGEGLLNPILIAIVLLALYLLWHARKSFAALLN